MKAPQKVVNFQFTSFITLLFLSLSTILSFWTLCIILSQIGLPFPQIEVGKFYDLGFFAVSAFSLIIFLTMIPFQTVELQLSPGFLARVFKSPKAHFGLYVLLMVSAICFLIPTLQQFPFTAKYLSQLFIALTASMICAIIFHRFWVLQSFYQPYVVYEHIDGLVGDESPEETWLELYESTHKAIKQGRINDARNFIDLMSHIFKTCAANGKNSFLAEDIESLYTTAQESRPVSRRMEQKWPFLLSKRPKTVSISEDHFDRHPAVDDKVLAGDKGSMI